MEQDISQHYRLNEKAFIKKIEQWVLRVDRQYAAFVIPFLTPREAFVISQVLANQKAVQVFLSGGVPSCERKRAVLLPEYGEISDDLFEIDVLEVVFPTKFSELTHRQILGTMMSTGIDRNRIGDIVTDGKRWQLAVDARLTPFLQQEITRIANVKCHLEVVQARDFIQPKEVAHLCEVIVSSLRLDTLIAKVCNVSRQLAKELVQSHQVSLNFGEWERPDVEIKEQDLISVRKYGRFTVESIEGTTKKGNYRLTVKTLLK